MKFNLNLQKDNYLISFTLNGKQKRFFPGTKDKLTTENIKARMEYEWNQGIFDFTLESYKVKAKNKDSQSKDYNLLELWDLWVNALDLPESTKNNHYYQVRQLILKNNPNWQDATWILEYKGEWSSYTFNSRKGFLKTCIKWCINQGLIQGSNPYESLKAKKKDKEDHVQPFSKEEINRIIESFEKSNPYYVPFIKFQFLTGARPGETIALQWRHVDFDKRRIYVEQALGRNLAASPNTTAKVLKSTKTGSKGYIPISDSLNDLLQTHRILTYKNDNDWVFPGKRGDYLDLRNFRKLWKMTLESLKIPYRYPYQTRHTVLSEVATRQGLLAASKLGRHKNTSMVAKHYARFVDEVELPDLVD